MSTPRIVTLGLVQMPCGPDPDENFDRAVAGVRTAADRGAQIVCLQELFRTQYFCQAEDHQYFKLAEPIPGPSTERLGALAAELGVVIVASLFEKRAEGLYHNTAAMIDADGSLLGKYRKMHIPDDPLYYEKFYFTPGDLGFRSLEDPVRPGRRADLLGPVVSRRRPAHRHAGRRRSSSTPRPSAGSRPRRPSTARAQHYAWETMQREPRHRQWGVRGGGEPGRARRPMPEAGIEFWGNSFVADPNGNVLARAGQDEEDAGGASAISAWSIPRGRIGRSCGTGGSMRTGI